MRQPLDKTQVEIYFQKLDWHVIIEFSCWVEWEAEHHMVCMAVMELGINRCCSQGMILFRDTYALFCVSVLHTDDKPT